MVKTHNSVDYYSLLMKTSKELMEILSQPLHKEYERLSSNNSPLLKLSLEKADGCDAGIKTNRETVELVFLLIWCVLCGGGWRKVGLISLVRL